jgi:hypothetical protein
MDINDARVLPQTSQKTRLKASQTREVYILGLYEKSRTQSDKLDGKNNIHP